MMTWTRKAPTSKGWYWWRATGYEPSVHYVDVEDGEPHAYYSDNGDDLFDDYGGEWSSTPIARPKEGE